MNKNRSDNILTIPQLLQYLNGTADEKLKSKIEYNLLFYEDEYGPLLAGLSRLKQNFDSDQALLEHFKTQKEQIAQRLGLTDFL